MGSIADIPASYLEGVSERIRLRNSQSIKQIRGSDEITEDIVGSLIHDKIELDYIEAHANKKLIVERALEELDADPISPEGAIEEEWLNSFDRYSRIASSDRLRDIWSRVLAGEVHSPGRFSLPTLRFISELDPHVASQFEEVTRIRSRVGRILTPKDLSGEIFDKMNLLQEVGLLQHVAGNAHTKAFIQADGYFYFFEDDFGLRVKPSDPSRKEIRLPCIFLTRVGKEISSILPRSDEVQFLRAAADYFSDESESIALMKVVSRNEDQSVLLQLNETIK